MLHPQAFKMATNYLCSFVVTYIRNFGGRSSSSIGVFISLGINTALGTLVTLQLESDESVADGSRGWHGPGLDAVHLLACGAL